MRKLVVLFVLLLVLFISAFSQEKIQIFEQEVKDIKNRVSPSLVKVIAENHKRYIATGIAIEKDLVLTSTLVTRYPYDRIYVQTVDGRTVPAKVVGSDRHQAIMLLRLNEGVMKPIRRSKNPDVGDWIALVGVFYNRFPAIVHGIVSSIAEDEMILNAPVFPGAPGGAVVNKKGELVAIIRGRFGVAIEPDLSVIDQQGEFKLRGQKIQNRSLCFAVPAPKMMEITLQLKKYGRVRRGWLGVRLASSGTDTGAMVSSVTLQSPALEAGLKKGDRIVSIDDHPIKETSDVGRIVRSLAPGHTARIEVERHNRISEIDVKLGELKSNRSNVRSFRLPVPKVAPLPELRSPFPQPQDFEFNWLGSRRLGVDVLEMTPGLARKFRVKEGHGLMVSRIHEKGVAGRSGIQAGDVIVRADKQPIESLADFRNLLDNLQDKKPIVLEYYRDGDLHTRPVVPEYGVADRQGLEDFKNRFRIVSDRFFNHFILQSKNAWRREHGAMLARLRELKANQDDIPEQELRRIEEKILTLERAYQLALENQLQQIHQKQRLLQKERARFEAEEKRLQNELKALKKKVAGNKNNGSSNL